MEGLAWAKFPMLERLQTLDKNLPVTSIYGGSSWVKTVTKEQFCEASGRTKDDGSYTNVMVRNLVSSMVTYVMDMFRSGAGRRKPSRLRRPV